MVKKLKYITAILVLISFWLAANGPLELIHKTQCNHHKKTGADGHQDSDRGEKHNSRECMTCYYLGSFLKSWSGESQGFLFNCDDIKFRIIYFLDTQLQDYHFHFFSARAPPSI